MSAKNKPAQVHSTSHRWLNSGFYFKCTQRVLPVLRALEQHHPNQHWQWSLALDYSGRLAHSHVFIVLFPLINLPLSVSPFVSPSPSFSLHPLFDTPPSWIRKPRPVSQLVSQQQVTQQFVLPSQPKKEKKERVEKEKSDREPPLKKNSHKKMR